MTLVSLPSPILWPGLTGLANGNPALANAATLDASGEYQAYVFVAKEDMVVSHIMFRAGTVAGSPTCTVGIETVDASGIPAGSAGFGSANGTTATISSNTTVLTALGASATIPRGSLFAVKITYASGTSVISQVMGTYASPYNTNIPYSVTNVSGSPVKAIVSYVPIIALGSSSTVFYNLPQAMPLTAYTGGGFNNTNSAKRGLKFTPPMRCRAIGVRWFNSTGAGDFNAGIYTGDASGTELSSSSTAFDGDAGSASANGSVTVYFDNAVTLTAGTAYRVAIEPTSATNCNVSTFTLPSSDYFTATPGGANSVYSALASSTWTDSTTQIPLMDVIIDQVDDGTGSGSGVVGVIGG